MLTPIKSRALRRAKIIEGQVRGVQKMIENDQYCMDILAQTLAIQKSLGSLNTLILENHVRTHIVDDLSSDNENKKSRAVDELLKLYELKNNRGK